MSANNLPPLPEPRTLSRGDEDGAIQLGYTADQMRAYAAQAVAAERERCAALCRSLMPPEGIVRRTLLDLENAIRKGDAA